MRSIEPVESDLRYEMLSSRQQMYVDWIAGGQTIIDDEGNLQPLTSIEFATKLGVTRQAIHAYRKLPGFWSMVRDRRTELYGQDRMSFVYKAMMRKAIKGDTSAMKLMMQQARVLEAERTQVDVTGTLAVAVVNYGTYDASLTPQASVPIQNPDKVKVIHREKKLLAGEKGQKQKVPVPASITSSPQLNTSDSPNAKPPTTREFRKRPPKPEVIRENTKAVVIQRGKQPVHFKKKVG